MNGGGVPAIIARAVMGPRRHIAGPGDHDTA